MWREGSHEAEAIAFLQQQPASTRIDLTLADWAQQRGDNPTAISTYQRVLNREPTNEDAVLGLAEIYAADGNRMASRGLLATLPAATPTAPRPINTQRRVAMVQAAVGDNDAARQTFSEIVPQAKGLPPSMESALVLRDAARFQVLEGQPQAALETYKDAMVASVVAATRPASNDEFT